MDEQIPFNLAYIAGNEFAYMQTAIQSSHASGDGPFTKRCHKFLETVTRTKKALLTTSCTHALEMAALLLELKPGDEVIIPSFTFVSTANAFALRGAKIVFIDIRPDTLNLDERLLEQKITKRTKAIVVVHYAGIACEMDSILAIANEHKIAVVEDNAHGLFGSYKENPLGSLGRFGTLSFHETKNFSCGEGGALLVNHSQDVERAEIIREKGTNRSRFFRGQVDKYSWVDIGSSYLPSDINAAFLYGQFERAQEIQGRRASIWNRYHSELAAWAKRAGAEIPTVPEHCIPAYHLFYLLMPTAEKRSALISYLKEKKINSVFHYLPLHSSEQGRREGGEDHPCPVATDISDRLLRLPFFNALSETNQERVIETVKSFQAPRIQIVQGLGEKKPSKRVAIVQSNYIPWKGYFDLINSVDEFILYDDVQYTKRDWRNRNQIKTKDGLQWLSVPVIVSGNRFQNVKDAKVSDPTWGASHWSTLTMVYGRTPFFKTYKPILEPLYLNPVSEYLSDINRSLILAVNSILGISTKISASMDYRFERAEKNLQLVKLCAQAGATNYVSGPAASSYLDAGEFQKSGITLEYFDYSGYREYRQLHPPFVHGVTVLDLLFNEGPDAIQYMKTFSSKGMKERLG